MNIAAYREKVRGFAGRGNYHAALNVALSALNECRRSNDQAAVDQCIGMIREVVDTLARVYGSPVHPEQQ